MQQRHNWKWWLQTEQEGNLRGNHEEILKIVMTKTQIKSKTKKKEIAFWSIWRRKEGTCFQDIKKDI